ncbi:peptidoglycan DD-metalloendopeptidase family protein [Agrobacterium sp. SHOUNA12C]|uniref:peptidoglycan DD-metalloendopeptidase family protein n=1 Tax=Rhizobium TaxID=379 RepID=UPI00026EC965|nr:MULTISPECIES: peptidoglycan DD-metalloendopeptidase family protein [Rhizobium]MCJ9725213.1 peptidoglycan DD-metalloendopeptidase family protein [Agrobacterium sp. BETTINA12B]MCJ9759090.1 peptidoglycan DD-metalloendopeptidase family protein [Agrobacterium sp. SHOUNA12C]OCJ06258.1 peptidoglycan-binding protein [Agrobacterium sp. 13-626]OCJ31372.1 peptidoglycan-binding protein [Agrobacterium sp. B133/95]EJK87239.1 metalloendopeptidase-like membrane protein [Rhizobium sp. AP16]
MGFSLSSNFGKSAGKVLVAILLASTATACSSDTTRFGGLFAGSPDRTTTGSINRGGSSNLDDSAVPRADVAQGGGQQQDYSQQNAPAARTYPNSPAGYNPSYSSARVSTAPVAIQRSDLAAPTASAAPARSRGVSNSEDQALAQPLPASRGRQAASRMEPALASDTTSAGTLKAPSTSTTSSGWTTVNAPSVTLQQGENIDLLSRRYGVPAKEILRANGLRNSAGAQPGQQIIIPTMNGAGGSSPAKVASEATDLSRGGKMPGPAKAPEQDAAVLPSNGQLRGKSQAGLADPNKLAAGNGKGPLPKGDGTYVVKPGDSLARIARNTGVSVDELKQANRMKSGEGVRVGQALKLPHAGADPIRTASIEPQKSAAKSLAEQKEVAEAPVTKANAKAAAAETAAKAAPKAAADAAPDAAKPQAVASAAPTQSVSDAATKSDVSADAPEATGIGKYRWPVRGAVIAGYGSNVNGSRNDGIDISVPEGTPIKAAENGVVIYAGNGLKELGNTVLVRHDDGTVTVYGHADALSVARGQKVQRGQTLATSGMSGDVKQPQLHFEVRKNSAPVNPMTFLE